MKYISNTVLKKSALACVMIVLMCVLSMGCSNEATSTQAINQAPEDNQIQQSKAEEPHLERQTREIDYQCDNGDVLSVEYIHSAQNRSAKLRYKARVFEMYSTRAASGAKYATEQGLNPEDGLIWWSQENQGTLIKMIKDDTVNSEDYPIIATCVQVS